MKAGISEIVKSDTKLNIRLTISCGKAYKLACNLAMSLHG